MHLKVKGEIRGSSGSIFCYSANFSFWIWGGRLGAEQPELHHKEQYFHF